MWNNQIILIFEVLNLSQITPGRLGIVHNLWEIIMSGR